MRLTLLGTGSADGWPNPFCGCPSCLATSTLRTPTSVLVDDTVLLDCGPEAPRQALRAGARLAGLGVIWVGHDHPDHSSPMALLSRGWALPHPGRPRLQVIGSPATLASWGQWIGPDMDVDLVPAVAGGMVEAAGYRLLPLAAAHGTTSDPGLLLRLTSPDGPTVLYGSDSGPLPDVTLDVLSGTRVDVVLLEETFGTRSDLARAGDHLDLAGFGAQLDRLRDAGVVDERTRVVAVHLSHHKPPGAALRERLSAVGAEPGLDGQVIEVGGAVPQGHRTLIVGGARSGKSTAAERLLQHAAAVDYVATGYPAAVDDDEWSHRVRTHQARRPASWRTVETIDLVPLLASGGPAMLIDCLTLWLTRTLDAVGAWQADAGGRALDAATDAVDALAAAWRSTPRRVVAVSNEVGSGVVPATVSGRVFRDLQGRLNANLGAAADTALLMVAGRTVTLEPVTVPHPPPRRA